MTVITFTVDLTMVIGLVFSGIVWQILKLIVQIKTDEVPTSRVDTVEKIGKMLIKDIGNQVQNILTIKKPESGPSPIPEANQHMKEILKAISAFEARVVTKFEEIDNRFDKLENPIIEPIPV